MAILINKICFLIGLIFSSISKVKNMVMLKYYTSLVNRNGSQALWIGPDTCLVNPQNIIIGENSYINGGYLIAGKSSKIIIGHDCLISYNVHIRTTSHNYSNPQKYIIRQGNYEKDILIGNNVWIGFGVQIMPGVSIGDNSIVGAGAVVTKSIPNNVIVAGVPAAIIKRRT